MNERPAPNFGGMRPPSVPFTEVRDRRRAFPLYFDVDLSTARSISAGTQFVAPVAGTFFYVDNDPTNVGVATVHFLDNNSIIETPIAVGPGANFRVPFVGLVIENTAQAGKRLRVIYGVDLDFVPGLNQPLTAGGIPVTITTTAAGVPVGADDETDNGSCFSWLEVVAAVAAQNGFAEIFNPVASGKRLYVDAVTITAAAGALNGLITIHNASVPGAPTFAHLNKKSGLGANSAMTFTKASNAGILGSRVGECGSTAVGVQGTYRPRNPIIIDPGFGIMLFGGLAATAFDALIEWREY